MAIQKNARRTAIRPGAGSDAWEALYGRRNSTKTPGRFVRERLPEPAGDDPAARLLTRLERVQRRGADRWSARCPAHEDKGPSLSVRALPDGRALLHCFAGCTAAEIVHAAGLTLADLYPPRPDDHHRPAERRPWRDAGLDAVRALTDEINITFVTACLVAGGIELTGDELDRMTLAAERCNGALHLIEGGRRHG